MKLGDQFRDFGPVDFGLVDLKLFGLVTGMSPDDALVASIVAQALPITPELGGTATFEANLLAALYQDDDAHDTCSLTACLNPLHPGPCKGWKGTLFDTAPAAWHALEAAKVEKANKTRLAKIEHLKSKGLPIPKKLLTPIVAKPHPHAGQTANKASGDAHKAGMEVSANAGVHVNAPGKVTLGQAVKTLGTGEKGPKGKKPTVASKGIAFVIGQEKVTPQYKLDKASAITPEQWSALSAEDKESIRGELTKIQKDGFGPQQKKATELLAKLDTKPEPKPETVTTPSGKVVQKITLKEMHEPGKTITEEDKKQHAETVAKAKAKSAVEADIVEKAKTAPPEVKTATEVKTPKLKDSVSSKKATTDGMGITTKPLPGGSTSSTTVGLPKGYTLSKDGMGYTLTYKPGPMEKSVVIRTSSTQEALEDYAKQHHAAVQQVLAKAEADGKLSIQAKFEVSKLTPEKVAELAKGASKPETVTTPSGKVVQKIDLPAEPLDATKPKALPKHVTEAIDMAHGKALGASWSKNHLAAYQKLSGEEFDALDPGTQDKIVSELKKGVTKFLDPKKIQATKELLAKFGHGDGKTPAPAKIENEVGMSTHLNDHSVTKTQAAAAVKKATLPTHFFNAKQTAGLTDADNPDSSLIPTVAEKEADGLVGMITKGYDPAVMKDPQVKAAMAELKEKATDVQLANGTHKAKSGAFNKISLTLAKDTVSGNGGTVPLSPIQKASLEHYQKYLLDHPVKTDPDSIEKLQADTLAATKNLDAALKAAQKKVSAPDPADMTDKQIEDRAIELMGTIAADPKVDLTLGQIGNANQMGKAQAETLAKKYPDVDITDPAVAAAYKKVVSLGAQENAFHMQNKILDDHIKVLHKDTVDYGSDIHGNKLTPDDKKVIAMHAMQLEAKFAHLKEAEQEKHHALQAAIINFKKLASTKAVAVHKPLSEFDNMTIPAAYSKAWSEQALKTVTYGAKTYDQMAAIKKHPQYESLKADFSDLKALAGKVALAHATEQNLMQAVPIDPDTGAMEHGSPEWHAWQAAVDARETLTTQFNGLHKTAQARLDNIRLTVGLKKRAIPKLDSPAVKAAAAETGYYHSGGYSGPNHGKPASAKSYMVSKVGPKIGVVHKTSLDKKLEKLNASSPVPAASTHKIENGTPAAPVTISGGDIDHIPDPLKKTITSDFKAMPKGKFLADPAEDIFGNLVNLAAAHGKGVDGGLSVAQVLKTIDATHSKNLGVANSGMLEQKVTDWLGTAAGKAYAEQHSSPNPKIVKQLTGELDLPEGVTLAPGEKVQKLAGPGPHDKSIPAHAFKAHTSAEAQQIQDAYMKSQGLKWTPAQKSAIKAYTGNGHGSYTTFNNYLRGKGTATASQKQQVIDIQAAMMPLTEHTLLKRGTDFTGLPFNASTIFDMVGETFEDKGFTSTAVAGDGGHFSGKPFQLVIEAPKGTAAAFVNGISHYKGQENEMLLAAGTKFKILSVEKTTHGHVLAHVRVVGDK